MPKRITLIGIVFGIGLAFAVQALVFVFLFYVPSISDQVVDRSDRPVLESVERIAFNSAVISAIAGGGITIGLSCIFKKLKKAPKDSAGAASLAKKGS